MRKSKTQFSVRAGAVLTAASAVWIWIFREITPGEMAILAGVTLTAGIMGHVAYTCWLPWRVTVMATVLLIYNALLGAQLLLQTSLGVPWYKRLVFLADLVVFPAEMMMHVSSPRDIVFSLVIVLGTVLFTPAHFIRPCLPAAIITAMGIGIWYGSSIMMMAYGG